MTNFHNTLEIGQNILLILVMIGSSISCNVLQFVFRKIFSVSMLRSSFIPLPLFYV